MRKFSLILMAVMVALLAGCAGDTTENEGDLATVENLVLDETSIGRTIVLTWSEVADVDGYKVYFKSDGTGDWAEMADVTTTTYSYTADNAGTYSVKAYEGTNYSMNYSSAVSTMPNIISVSYTIYDNFSASDNPSGFIFGSESGQTGMAGSTSFVQDIYAYQDSKGNTDVSLYSGNEGLPPYNNGNNSDFLLPVGDAYGNCDPNASWLLVSLELFTSDSVVFVRLPYINGTNAYAKMYGMTITPDTTENGTKVSFMYEYQPNTTQLTVFTSNAN